MHPYTHILLLHYYQICNVNAWDFDLIAVTIRSDFSRNDESWKYSDGEQECTDDCLPVTFDGANKNIAIQGGGASGAYFLAPGNF